ncbi:hypothetical protein KC887_04915 [Candidatus Kaiserbacteria bacterium]|nr:hypothetical protein [Candidatus Kaiserbacteria bacterium]
MAQVKYYPKRGAFNILQAGSSVVTYDSFMASLSPQIWYKFDEASGNLVNYGSYSGAGVVTGSPTYGVAGSPTGADAIRLSPGSPQYFTMANDASLDVETFTYVVTLRLMSVTVSLGRIYQWEAVGGGNQIFINNDRKGIWTVLKSSGAATLYPAASNQMGASLPCDWVTIVYIHNGTTMTGYCFGESITFKTDTATVGAGTVDAHTGGLIIGNRADEARQIDAIFGGFARYDFAWSLEQAQTLEALLYP